MQVLEVGKTYNVNLNIKMNNGMMRTDMPVDIINRVIKNALKDVDVTLCGIGHYTEEGECVAS